MVILYIAQMFLKLNKGIRIISIFIICNFVNMVMVNLVIHLVKYFYALLSPPHSSQNPSKLLQIPPPPPLKNIQTKQFNLLSLPLLYSPLLSIHPNKLLEIRLVGIFSLWSHYRLHTKSVVSTLSRARSCCFIYNHLLTSL